MTIHATEAPTLASPGSATPMTVGLRGVRLDRTLLDVAGRAGALAVLTHLVALTEDEKDPAYVGALTSFVSSPDVIACLGSWRAEEPLAGHLEALARAIWSTPLLATALRPFGADQKVAARLRGNLEKQYLAAMAAARAPYTSSRALARFVQRFRTLCILRATAALDVDGAIRETALEHVCTSVRMACDTTNDQRLDWLEAIATDVEDLSDFSDSIAFNCRRELGTKSWSAAARAFFRKAIVVANGGPWKATAKLPGASEALGKLPGASRLDDWMPWFPEPDVEATPGGASDLVESGNSMPGVTAIVCQTVAPGQTPSQVARAGDGLIIDRIETLQFLRQSWHHLSSEEERALAAYIHRMLGSDLATDRLGAAILLAANVACRSMKASLRLPIGQSDELDWSLDLKSGTMRRAAPRFHRRWRAETANATAWVHPMAPDWVVALCDDAVGALRVAARRLGARDLGDLWKHASPNVEIDTWFAQGASSDPSLARLNGKCTERALLVPAYLETGNHALARLIGSQEERTGLPAACAYGAYRSPLVHDTLAASTLTSLFALHRPSREDDLNACGSELDLAIKRVGQSIGGLITRTNDAASDSSRWVEYHNSLTSLVIIALLASTGARPVKSPFESLAWFDFDRLIVYVADKVAGPTRGSRLCVLSQFAADLLQTRYLPHLRKLAAKMAPFAPQFAAEIEAVLAASPEAPLPLLFFLHEIPTLDWIEVDETQLELHSGIDWPLPWNVFRHLQATALPRRGVCQEIVDALLGHADRDAESHGKYSFRIPRDDLETARAAVESIQAELRLALPNAARLPTPLLDCAPISPPLSASRPFGRTARQVARRNSHQAARERARRDIQESLGQRPPESLRDDEWEEIALRMLFREGHLPHPAASLRFEVFEEFLSTVWHATRKLPKLRRRFTLIREGAAWFDDSAIGAPDRLARMSRDFDAAVAALGDKPVGVRLAGILAAFDLVLTGGVAHRRALYAMACLHTSVQLVRFQDRYYFEWAYADAWQDGKPVFRREVRGRTARWIALAMSGSQQLKELPAIPRDFKGCFSELGSDLSLKAVLDGAAHACDQVNRFRLPGTDAAYLAGELMFPALPHADWVRLETGTALAGGRSVSDDMLHPRATDAAPYVLSVSLPAPALVTGTAEACADLFEAVRALIAKDGIASDHLRVCIERAVEASPFRSGDMPYVLASFMGHLCVRRPKSGGHDRLRISTLRRAWYALAAPLADLAHDKSFADMDEEELTELYIDVVGWWEVHFEAVRTVIDSVEPPDQKSNASDAADAARRTLLKLREFHAYAEQAFGVDDPDWSEISTADVGAIGRPGFVTASEYQRGIDFLLAGRLPENLPDDDLAAAFTWVLCGRFGLRIGEAVGMFRHDWLDPAETIVVLVQPNRVRPLKTRSSRRKVPLIGSLSDAESGLAAEVIKRWLDTYKQAAAAPLLPGVDQQYFGRARGRIAERLSVTVKAVTCHASATVHMLRHAFASRTFATLRGQAPGAKEPVDMMHVQHVRQLLLGHGLLDRRGMWSVAGLMGHAGPGMSARCYIHGLDSALEPPQQDPPRELGGIAAHAIVNLDVRARETGYGRAIALASVDTRPPDRQGTCLLRYLRLVMQGYKPDRAAKSSRLDDGVRQRFETFLLAHDEKTVDLRHHPILSSISPAQWQSLVSDFAASAEVDASKLYRTMLPSFGRRTQLVLFEPEHFQWLYRFAHCLQLEPTDLTLVCSAGLHVDVQTWLDGSNLRPLVRSASDFGDTFQLDTAEAGRPPRRVQHRVVAVPNPNASRLRSKQMLWVMWHSWLAALPDTIAGPAAVGSAHDSGNSPPR